MPEGNNSKVRSGGFSQLYQSLFNDKQGPSDAFQAIVADLVLGLDLIGASLTVKSKSIVYLSCLIKSPNAGRVLKRIHLAD